MLASARPYPFGTLDDARRILRAHFGYPDFRPPQIRAVEAVLSGRDALIVLPTGGGKSLCYQVPALVRGGLAVVVSPLISLMTDQVDTLKRRGVAAAYINSTLGAAATAERMARARDGTLRLLYLSPERLEAGRTLEQLRAIGIRLLAVDEAHCISEWGHDFRPSYRRIGQLRERLGGLQTVALTATATPAVRRDIIAQLALDDPDIVVGGFDRTNLSYEVRTYRRERDKDDALVTALHDQQAPAIVYAPTRKAVERVTALLRRAGLAATAYHAGLEHSARQQAQEAFMAERTRLIVATSAFGMGIDKPDVRLVVHHAMPGSLEAYYQEAGRAGRDGQPGHCLLLYSAADRDTHEFFLEGTHPSRPLVEGVWTVLRGLADDTGHVPLVAEALVRHVAPTFGERAAGAALRVLMANHVCTVEAAAPGRVWVRLLATPERIIREIGSAHVERELLRALWRAAGRQLEQGAVIDLDGLSPGMGDAGVLVPILERLEARQFVAWIRHGGGMRVARRARRMATPPVNWRQLERRRRTDRERLDAMEAYVHTRHCRRAYVLHYFGDAGARPQCGACDRCFGGTGPTRPAARILAVRARSRARF